MNIDEIDDERLNELKLPQNKQEAIEFYKNCKKYINATLDVDIKLRDKYKQILKLSKDKKQKEEYKEKLDNIEKDINYYQEKVNKLEKRIYNVEHGIIGWD